MPELKTLISLFFIFHINCYGRSFGPKDVAHDGSYRSPLDEQFTDYYSDESSQSSDSVEFIESGDKFPSNMFLSEIGANKPALCDKNCMKRFEAAMHAAVHSPNNYDRFQGVCDNYNETIVCMNGLDQECDNQEAFDVFTSGLHYMCIEQRKAFEAVIECIDAQALSVEKECEGVCHAKERLAQWAVQSGLLDNFMQGALGSLTNGEAFTAQLFGRGRAASRNNPAAGGKIIEELANTFMGNKAAGGQKMGTGPGGRALGKLPQQSSVPAWNRMTPEFMKNVINDGCDLTRCQLTCVRVKFDAKCGGSAGTLLSETFVRPMAESQKLLSLGTMTQLIGAFLPPPCDFMIKSDVLSEFRIPKELDDVLHQKYDDPQPAKETVGDSVVDAGGDGAGVEVTEEQLLNSNETLIGEAPDEGNQQAPGNSEGENGPPPAPGPAEGSAPQQLLPTVFISNGEVVNQGVGDAKGDEAESNSEQDQEQSGPNVESESHLENLDKEQFSKTLFVPPVKGKSTEDPSGSKDSVDSDGVEIPLDDDDYDEVHGKG